MLEWLQRRTRLILTSAAITSFIVGDEVWPARFRFALFGASVVGLVFFYTLGLDIPEKAEDTNDS